MIQAAAIASDLLDARCVVFGGPYWEIVEPLYGPMARDALSADGARPGVQVLSSAQGTDAGAIGAASTVLDAHFVPRRSALTPPCRPVPGRGGIPIASRRPSPER